MARLAALSVTPRVRAWLRSADHARILHIFERAVNLIAGDDVISLVTPEIGNGPFNVVLPAVDFAQRITSSAPLRITPNVLHIGDLSIEFSSAATWNPYPDWPHLRDHQTELRAQAPVIRAVLQQHAPANSFARLVVELPDPLSGLELYFVDAMRQHWQNLVQSALNLDRAACMNSAARIVGLGSGLTPAGDDWLLGCALAAHLDLPTPAAAALLLESIRCVAPGTNPLSAGWLRAAVDGACSHLWHTFFAGCVQSDAVDQAALSLVRQGHSSGADALAGYVALLGSVL